MDEVITKVLSNFEKKLVDEDGAQQRKINTIFTICYLFYIFGEMGFLASLLTIFSIYFNRVRT